MRLRAVGLGALFVCLSRASWAQEPEPAEITIQGARRAPAPTELTVSGEMAREAAGTQGDPVKVLQSLPGLGRGGIGGGELVMWGSEPRESRIEVDGVEIPRLYHGSGVRSVVPAGVIDAVHSVPGAFGPEHGRALGGLVLVDTTAANTVAPRLRASADLLDASVLASVPVRSIDGAAQVGFRYGYVDRWLPRLINPELRGLYRVPAYWDANSELNRTLRRGETIRLVLLSSSDESQTELLAADASRREQLRDAQRFGRIYLEYRNASIPGQQTLLTPFVGWDRAEQSLAVEQATSGLNVSQLRYGLRAHHRVELGARVALALGVDAAGSVARVERQGSLSVPRREGDPFPFGTPPGSEDASDAFRAHVLGVAPFVETELQLTPSLRVSPSLRFEPTLIETSRARPPLGSLPDIGRSTVEPAIEPRLAIEQRLSSSVRLFAAAGRYYQPPDMADLSAAFGNPGLGLASATHLVAGESARLASRTRVEVAVFGKWLSGLATRTSQPEPLVGRTLVDSGRGRAFGCQVFVKQAEIYGLSGWLSATLARSERQGEDGTIRLSDFDSPLVVAASLLQRLGAFRVGARARFASGAPRTPVVGAYYDVASQRYQPVLGPTNTARLPDFFQLDLRVDRRFELGAATSVELYLDALNVTAHTNREEWAYSSDFRRIGSVSGLPPLAIVGVTVER